MAAIKQDKRSGKWQVQIARKGVRKSKRFSTKKEAEAWAIKEEQRILANDDAGFVQTTALPILSILQRYKNEKGHEWSASKARAVARLEHDMPLTVDDLKPLKVEQWVRQREFGLGTSRIDLKTLQGAIKHYNKAAYAAIDYSVLGVVVSALEARGAMPKVNKRERRVSVEEEHLIREHWQSDKVPPNVVAFLIDTPIRSGEMCRLQSSDVDGRIMLLRDRKDPAVSNRVDRVPLLGRSYEILRAQTGERPFPYSQNEVSAAIRAATKAAGLEDLRTHDLRHEGISRLFDAGWNIPQVALVSGHRDWKTLSRYTHMKAEMLLDLPTT